MTSSSEQDSNGKVGSGARPITREDEGRVRRLVAEVLAIDSAKVDTQWLGDRLDILILSWADKAQPWRPLSQHEVAKVGRAGIVPGPEGWCWAAAPAPSGTKPPREGGCPEVCPERMIARGMYCEKSAGHDGPHFADRRGVGCSHWHDANDGDERPLVSFGWWESLDDWALYSDFPARGKKIAEIVLEAEEYRWRALDGSGGIFGAGGAATLEDAKANAERVCRARGTMPVGQGERVEEQKAPPAWLTAAVLAALPVDGTPRALAAVVCDVLADRECAERFRYGGEPDGATRTTLAHLVSTGEIEAGPEAGTWRRWGVPEGWHIRHDQPGWSYVVRDGRPLGDQIAAIGHDGGWTIFQSEEACNPLVEGRGGQRAALRACWERGVFGTRSAPVAVDDVRIREDLARLLAKGPRKAIDLFVAVRDAGALENFTLIDLRAHLDAIGARRVYAAGGERWEAGNAPAPTAILAAPSQGAGMGEQRAIAAAVAGATPSDRPSQLRAALLSVLSRGPVEGLARLLPALDAAMGEAPGVARATGAEARQAAREVGAVVDGARWSLPAMVPGWGWRLSYVPRCWFITRLDAEDVEGGSVATVESEHGTWGWQLAGAPAWSEADSLAEAQAAALAAARRAGLFAPRSAAAVDVTGVGSPAVLPAVTAKDGSPIVYPAPNGPLDAAVLAILATASPAEITAHLAAWGAMLVEQARAPRHTIEAIGDQIGTVTARRVHGEDGEVVSMPHLTDSASVQAQAAAILQRDTIDPAWGALEARATTAEVNATHWQARAEQAERAAAEARLEAESAAAARDTLARDYAAERALSESLRAQLDEAETARDDARAALSDLRAALADLAARWAGGAK